MINAILIRFAEVFCRWLEMHYRFPKESFYCEHLWLRVSIHQDGRLEPCSCAISKMEPKPPTPSIHSVWNSSIYKETRKYLTGKMADSGKIPFKRQDVFDCCASCPLAPTQRVDRIYLKKLLWLVRTNIPQKFSRNIWLLFKKLNNFRKLAANAKVGSSQIDAHPIFASIDPASVCNIRCLECEVGKGEHKHPPGMMTWEVYEEILREIGPYLISASLFRYGEPLLNKNILRMIDLAENQYGIITSVSTNFSMPLTEEFLRGLVSSGLSQIVIAADDVVQELYVKYRVGGDVHQVIQNLKNLVRIRKEMNSSTPEIVWQSLIFSFNDNRKDEIGEFVKNLGVDNFVFIPAYFSPKNYDLLPENKGVRGRKTDRKAQVVNAKITPAVVYEKEKFILEVEVMQNIFKEPIPVSPKDSGIRVGVKLADKDREELENLWLWGRLFFEKPLAAGEKVTLTQELTVPEISNYERVAFLKIDLVMEFEFWFEQNTEIQSLPYFLQVEFKKQPANQPATSSTAEPFP